MKARQEVSIIQNGFSTCGFLFTAVCPASLAYVCFGVRPLPFQFSDLR